MSKTYCVLFLLFFSPSILYPMLPASLGCLFLLCFFSFNSVFYVASFSGLSIFALFFLLQFCTLCCQLLWVVYFCFVFSPSILYPMLPASLGCLFLISLSVFSNVYLKLNLTLTLFLYFMKPK